MKYLKEARDNRFHDFFEIINNGELAAIAALTHPKFRAKWISCFDKNTQAKIKRLVEELVWPKKPESAVPDNEDTEDTFFDFDDDSLNASLNTAFAPQEQEENELMRFLNKKTMSLESLNNLPVVKSLFLKFNTTLPSSAPVERLFSNATLMNMPKFNRLFDIEFEKRVLYKANGLKSYL
ncbi:hypothetical protein, partial [Escherichia coli]|uniref:hypothetical protein n=1 Tax=Escherichia coli TaxID=562 RepID=UPI002916AF81